MGMDTNMMRDGYVFMCSIKSHIQLRNSINNADTGLIQSVPDVPFETGIDHVFILKKNNTNPKQFKGLENTTNQRCEEMIDHFLYIKKKRVKSVELWQRLEWTIMNLSGRKLIQNKWR